MAFLGTPLRGVTSLEEQERDWAMLFVPSSSITFPSATALRRGESRVRWQQKDKEGSVSPPSIVALAVPSRLTAPRCTGGAITSHCPSVHLQIPRHSLTLLHSEYFLFHSIPSPIPLLV
jgi:hypothetical protein